MRLNIWNKFKAGFLKASDQLTNNIKHIVGIKVDARVLDNIEDMLIMNDFGVHTAGEMREYLKEKFYGQTAQEHVLKEALKDYIIKVMEGADAEIKTDNCPTVIMLIGVNGAGKTTTLAKLSQTWRKEQKKIEWVAGDTFRSAAREQLSVWSERLNILMHSTKDGGDSAGLAYDAYNQAISNKSDVLLIDTAGRLHNKENLMGELDKIKRVIQKINADAPHYTILVLDATTGQNMHMQLKTFNEKINISGIIVTKLDGTAKAGSLINLYQTYKKPIYAIGIGEKEDDLQPFSSDVFAHALLGLESL